MLLLIFAGTYVWQHRPSAPSTPQPPPPELPQRLTPGQAAQLSEVLEYLHVRIRTLLASVRATEEAESVVLDRRVSDSHKGFGIVTWHTTGFNQREEKVIDFKRTNLVRQREAA